MAREYSSYQKDVISNYYRNLDAIKLTRLQEMVTELYLAESENKRAKLWVKVDAAMRKIEVPERIRSHIMAKKDVTILAKNVEDWLKKS